MSFRHALCNEIFNKWEFAKACQAIRNAGYTGIEIAPFTVAEDATKLPGEERRRLRRTMTDEGLQFVGLHWLMVSPEGYHVTTPERSLRERSWEFVRDLVHLAADLGPNAIMVFGSPKQRNTTGGLSPADAAKNYTDGLASVAPTAEQRGVTILVEALPKAQSDVINTLAEAVAVVNAVGSPCVKTMFDTHNAADETEPHAAVVDKHFDLIRHVHVNEMDGRHCGTGNYNFRAIFDVLKRRNYQHWVSLEVFDFTAGAENIANESLRYLESEINHIQ